MKITGSRNTKTRSIKPAMRIILAVSLLLMAVLIAEYIAVIMDTHMSALAKTEKIEVAATKQMAAAKEAAKVVNTTLTSESSNEAKAVNLLNEDSTVTEYKITVFAEDKNLYTSERVNVRSGAGTEFDKVGSINRDSKVKCLGVTDNGWYQVMIGDEVGYISCDYLQEQEPGTEFIFAGDSRTVQMSQAINKSDYEWIAKVGEGYNFFSNEAIPQIDENVGDGSVIIINYGVNDLYNADKYIELVNKKVDSWIDSGATVYYAAVTPVSDYPTITNDDIENFNNELKEGLDSRIGWLDGYSYLQNNGFSTGDGLHYNSDTYKSLYKYYMNQVASNKVASFDTI